MPTSSLIPMPLPYADGGIPAGFPSPAQDYLSEAIDLNQVMVTHRECTFYARVVGDSMTGCGIFDGDLAVVDRLIEAHDGDVVVACVDGEFTIKQLRTGRSGQSTWLVPANRKYRPLRVDRGHDFMVWGVVTYTIHPLR